MKLDIYHKHGAEVACNSKRKVELQLIYRETNVSWEKA
jgi:hypothetical protein